ncbi:MAG: phosphoribosylformylglycinamidine synthase subunit PurQ [Akkermansiaceae bacterium]|nr:phosphoribosylformylglycinamidine synthase subunit PurQ [Akkermansiaceae bacterium]
MNRIFVEKKPGHQAEALHLFQELQASLLIPTLTGVRILQRYDCQGLIDAEFESATRLILSEPQVDSISTTLSLKDHETAFGVEFLPGQFDQRADSAAQCVQILTGKDRPLITSAKIIVLQGDLTQEKILSIKAFVINAVDSHEVPVSEFIERHAPSAPADVAILTGFATQEPSSIRETLGLAMSAEDVAFCQTYFRDEEQRDPSITELRMLDTYWSDHCRHTTFLTKIEAVTFSSGTEPVQRAWEIYQKTRKDLGREDKPITLMDIALIGMRELKKSGELDNLEVSEEVNAASIVVPVSIDGRPEEEWLVMFKNETHNHPTEIEPFGGAATCLGGCIRDPLSGRSYVYQAMRVTGAADPRTAFSETLPGKLPQKKICQVAARGYSSYGNQIGLATGQVAEVYHPGYVAKRLEIGAVVAAAPRSQVFRGSPSPGDVILLIGGRTGRDGVGGATGSSKEHTDTALENSAEVQKGDAPTERKIQRLFRNPELTRKIKICNDFGAGGISVAIGEIAPSLEINLDAVSKKYDGLDGTELAISESQERMAICVDRSEVAYFIEESARENLECNHVANVTDSGRLIMTWRGKTIVNLSREFLDTNGVQQSTAIHVGPISAEPFPFSSKYLTPPLSYRHEHTALSQRITPQELRKGFAPTIIPALEAVERVHRASEKPSIPQPQTRQQRAELDRAIRSLEERELSQLSHLDASAFLDAWEKSDQLGGAEHKVYPDGSGHFIKANNGIYHGTWLQFFQRLHLHRLLFPETAYEFLGLINDPEFGTSVLLSQAEVYAARAADGSYLGASRRQVETFMTRSLGAFRFRNDDYYIPALDLFIEDLHDENVLVGSDGETLHFIDPVIYLRPLDVPIPVALVDHSLVSRLGDLNVCSQKGLGEMFDGSVGAGTVLWPFGGDRQLTPPDAMVAKIPLLEGNTDACTFMSWGFNPEISSWSPFHGALYAVTESVCKAVAAGAKLSDIRLTLQEYFPKLGNDPSRWGLPFSALLGAYQAQHSLRLAAIGGKDSMSGSFNDLDVPPTLVSFALAPGNASLALSPEFKQTSSKISLVEVSRDANHLPDFDQLRKIAAILHELNSDRKILALHHIGQAGIAAAIAKMSFGNHIGANITTTLDVNHERYFAFIIEHRETLSNTLGAIEIGQTTDSDSFTINDQSYDLTELQSAWTEPLEAVYPTRPVQGEPAGGATAFPLFHSTKTLRKKSLTTAVKVIIPSFPGTNSEYDSAKAFQEAGANAEILVFRNRSASDIEDSLTALAARIRESQILMFPGGFSAGDEPDGSAKFIATIIRSPRIADAITDLLQNRDGLILGICNGFQALVKTGLVPYGEIRDSSADAPTLVHNQISRHISCYARTRVISNLSPWLAESTVGDIHRIPVSHGEGKFYASPALITELANQGQIATQYCDADGHPAMNITVNPNGSLAAIEGITSPCGRVFGKMAHTERAGSRVASNIPGNKIQPLFTAGVAYFR